MGRKKMRTRLSVLAFVLAALVALTGCTGNSGTGGKGSGGGETTPPVSEEGGTEPEVLSFTVYQPYFGAETARGTRVDQVWQEMMEEYLGVKLDITWEELPWGDFNEKRPIYLASGEFADIFLLNNVDEAIKAGERGALVDLSTKLDLMPYSRKFLESDLGYGPEVNKISTPEGKFYTFPNAGDWAYQPGGLPQYVYRFDIFQKHNIPIPGNLEEYYNAAKRLKELYPDAYPVGSGFAGNDPNSIQKSLFELNRTSADIFFNGDKFLFGPIDDSASIKRVLEYLNKLYEEKLLDPEFFTQTNEQQIEKSLTGKIFMMPNSFTGWAGNHNKSTEYPQTWGVARHPLNLDGQVGWYQTPAGKEVFRGNTGPVISASAANQDLLIKLMDYQYSPEMINLFTWGIEGETYVETNGEKNFLDEILLADDPYGELAKFGVNTSGSVRSGIQWGAQALETSDKIAGKIPVYADGKYYEEYNYLFHSLGSTPEATSPILMGPSLVSLSAEELELRDSNLVPIKTHFDGESIRFITGQRKFDTWDKFIEELKGMGNYEAVTTMYNEKLK